MSALAKVLERSRFEKESWRYTDLAALLGREKPVPTVAKIKVAQRPQLVFIDGVLQSDHSHMLTLPQNTEITGANGVYEISVAKEACLIMQPLELSFISMGSGSETATKLKINLGESASLPLIERHEGSAAPHTIETEIVLQKQAKLLHGKIVRGGTHIGMTHVQIEEGAYYDNFTLLKGGITRNEIEAQLKGKLAQCNLNGAMLAKGRDHLDTTTRIVHAAPHGTSREFYKSVVGDAARAVFQGKILVEKLAQKTDGHQLSRALLLSDRAEMDAKPELEIYADDVKCSHGSTVGDLDDTSLFYLQSRGIGEEDARALLIEGFIGEILDEIRAPELMEACRAEVEEWLREGAHE